MKNTAILLCGVPLLLATACTSSFSKVRGAINDAPEWYGARRTEIRGEGYPKIADIPTIDANWKPADGLAVSGDEMRALQQQFDTQERAQVAPEGAARIANIAAEIRAEFEPGLPEGEFFTETEIAAIRESFNVPRVTEGVISR
ncbi:MAG: hypothetical protein IPK75_15920 [Acidobacteria bacterium]|jgi:hypothetical protein|nr:hypothetical protein [Acidobacteriota bacterium]